MLARLLAALAVTIGGGSAARAEPQMKLTFTWAGTVACARSFVSPALTLENVPGGTRTFTATLSSASGRELGSGTVAYDGNAIAPGSIKTRGPCQPSTYTWAVEARDGSGAVLARADRDQHFPD